ncbi:MAG: sugar ABC transporter ATP-binding protein [Hyphomicrobiaceae bacterium]|nr:sugar ABC transporter ATP-binding protein [Hyphomicrobiaceae bacterium]MCC0022904.1 sugar ABC transporter ATP-binding protein [Hyphomicrobiaceae bacterium]
MPLLELSNVSKAYAGTPALRQVDLKIEAGEVHALMGENGAGKSTLIKILAGVVAPDSATIRMDDRLVSIDDAAKAHRLGFRFIHQELNVVPSLSVAENIVMGQRYPRRAGIFVDWKKLNSVAADALRRLGVTHIDPRVKMASLSTGDRMLAKISAALLSADGAPARLYVMDEPTAALTREESEQLFRVLNEIRAAGNSVLYVSHRIDEVMALCDRATVLRDGQSIDSGMLSEITHDDLVAMMTGRKVTETYPAQVAPPSDETAYEGHGLSVRKGEILGLAGLSGSGQTELLRRIFGRPASAWRRGIAYVPKERRSEGLVLTRPIFENITLPHLKTHSLGGAFLAPGRERGFATSMGDDVKLRATSTRQLVQQLSGGNQQKVVFAKALSGEPDLLLLDEPTRGVDVGAKYDIYSVIREMTAKGMAVILASSDLPELLGLCDRIAVMRNGSISIIVEAGLSEDALLNLCYGRATHSEAA